MERGRSALGERVEAQPRQKHAHASGSVGELLLEHQPAGDGFVQPALRTGGEPFLGLGVGCAADFLEPDHFYEQIHRAIFEVCGKIIRAGKTATPVTAKTYLPDDLLEGVTMAQYLARLAAEATTVLNAADYGQAIYDLAIRRNLILIGEEVIDQGRLG